MRITFLGTGTSTGIPVIGCKCPTCLSTDRRDDRLRTSALWEVNGYNILIDVGPDFRAQMIRANINRVNAILVTHQHYDHVGGLDDVRGLNYSMGESINVFAEPNVAAAFRHNLSYIFAENKYPGVPEIGLHEIDASSPFEACPGIVVTPIRVLHGKLPIVGFRINNWAYITDASYISDESLNLLHDLDVLVINALRYQEHMSHFSVGQALEVVAKVKPKRTYFTHIAHHLPPHAEVQANLPENVSLAYDGLIVNEL